jgi:cation transport ATPase
MSSRFLTNMMTALLGGFIVVESLTFSHPAEKWVAFAVAIAAVGIALGSQLDATRGTVQRALDSLLAATAGTMIGISVVYAGATAMWLDFALALGLVGVSVAGLTLNEVTSWRASHGLAELHPLVSPRRLRAQPPAAQAPTGTRVA